MKIEELMSDKEYLEAVYTQCILKRIIVQKKSDLSKVHIAKSDSNMEFVKFLLENNKFFDWAVVGLYYSVYHAALALLSRRGYSSKEHNATLCFLIKNYSEFSADELGLIDELQITRDEIEFYSGLKDERNKASYSTSLLFNKDKVYELREKSILLINKIKSILEK